MNIISDNTSVTSTCVTLALSYMDKMKEKKYCRKESIIAFI